MPTSSISISSHLYPLQAIKLLFPDLEGSESRLLTLGQDDLPSASMRVGYGDAAAGPPIPISAMYPAVQSPFMSAILWKAAQPYKPLLDRDSTVNMPRGTCIPTRHCALPLSPPSSSTSCGVAPSCFAVTHIALIEHCSSSHTPESSKCRPPVKEPQSSKQSLSPL